MINFTRASPVGRYTLIASIFLSLCPLFFFKYFPWLGSYLKFFLTGTTQEKYILIISNIVLPVGISFFTFQAMSYTIDLYYGRCRYCPSLLKFAAYVSMFPQLVAGPIIRFRQIDEQLDQINQSNNRMDIRGGSDYFFRGLIKKVVFADQIGILIDPSFIPGTELSTSLAWISMLGYSLQIYFDFSGYSDMAIGIGKCLGFQFPENFKAPYTAKNPAEFWRRWHVTLSNWLRDYLYIPMGGNRKGKSKTYINLMLTMVLGGLWHGASWNFLFWGLWHGLFLCIHRITPDKIRNIFPNWLCILFLNIVVIVGWVFFRAPSIPRAFHILWVMLGFHSAPTIFIPWHLLFIIIIGFLLHFLERRDLDFPFRRNGFYATVLALLSVIAVLELGRDTPFIYFQF
ncbi:MBOAT family O-acyltransferase [Thermodesulfobacteriota bacterium]